MNNILLPKWLLQHYFQINDINEIPDEIFNSIRRKFEIIHSKKPEVSIVVIAYNEEKTILKSLSSLASLVTKYNYEVIVANNNSSDRTQEILDRCGVKSILQPMQGVGYARQAGMDLSSGKYHLCADADTIYPPKWIDEMVAPMINGKAVAVFGRVSFLPDGNKGRITLAFYELFKDVVIGLRAIKRPELVAGGASLGFIAEKGKALGWRTDVKRGEDGQMILALKKQGNIKMIKSSKSRIWTTARTLDRDGNFFAMVSKRLIKEFKRIGFYFTSYRQQA